MSSDQEDVDERAYGEAYRAPAMELLTAATYEDLKRRGQTWAAAVMLIGAQLLAPGL